MVSMSMLSISRRSIGERFGWYGSCEDLLPSCNWYGRQFFLGHSVYAFLKQRWLWCRGCKENSTPYPRYNRSSRPVNLSGAPFVATIESPIMRPVRGRCMFTSCLLPAILKQAAYHAPQPARTSHPAPPPAHSSSSSTSTVSPHRFPHSTPPSSGQHS